MKLNESPAPSLLKPDASGPRFTMSFTFMVFLSVAAVVVSSFATDALSSDAGRSLPSTASRSITNQSLRQKIIYGAEQKLLKKEYNPTSGSDDAPPAVGARKGPHVAHGEQCTYYIREARRSGESTSHLIAHSS
jgi:hypothetical protein